MIMPKTTQKKADIWWAVITIGLSSLVWWLGLALPIKVQIEKVSLPLTTQANQIILWLGQPVKILSERAAGRRRVEELEKDYSQALAEIANLRSLRAENEELRRLLELEPRENEAVVTSTITAYGQPSLNLGSESGLKRGLPVLASDNLVGLIGQTSAYQSQVVLLIHNRLQPILAETEAGTTGLVIGDGRRVLLTEIDKMAQVKIGELVVTSGQNGIGYNLVIGRILQLIDQPTAPTKQAILELPISFYDVSVVEVLL